MTHSVRDNIYDYVTYKYTGLLEIDLRHNTNVQTISRLLLKRFRNFFFFFYTFAPY